MKGNERTIGIGAQELPTHFSLTSPKKTSLNSLNSLIFLYLCLAPHKTSLTTQGEETSTLAFTAINNLKHDYHNMKYFFFNDGQQQRGPFEVNELLQNGLNATSQVWCEGMPGWVPATHVPEIANLLNAHYTSQQGQQAQYGYQQPGASQPPYSGCTPGMELGDAVKSCFNQYVNFEGRARRSEFWWFFLFSHLLAMVSCGFAAVVTFLPLLAVGARRLHDTGRTGWWQLLHLVPLGTIILLVWWCEDSHSGGNEYGPSVKY